MPAALLFISVLAAAAPAPHVSGTAILDPDGRPLSLRGANWGWWRCVEPQDAGLMAQAGANAVRIAFFWSKIVAPDDPEQVGGEGLQYLDSMVRWAQEAGLWIVLDCHEPPGGCNTAAWCAGGHNGLWREAHSQSLFLSMWRQLAGRYRDNDRLLAYELYNEPVPPADLPVEEYRALCLRAIDEIRAVDPEHAIVVSGPAWSSPGGLTDEMLLDRPNLIYTFHFYSPGDITHYQGGDLRYPGTVPTSVRWLGNSPEDWGATGTCDWTPLQKTFVAPDGAVRGQVMLRSSHNAGQAWFDDVELECEGEPVDLGPNTDFAAERGSTGWQVERPGAGDFTWDGAEGRGGPGSLSIAGTDSYNSWRLREAFLARPGARYTLRCRVKCRDATGHTYPAVAWFSAEDTHIDREWLARQMRPAIEFSRRNRVAIYCGEFGCSQSVPEQSGLRWVEDVAGLLEEQAVPWTYWNWKETTGPGSMGVWVQKDGRYVPQEPLQELLGRLWAR